MNDADSIHSDDLESLASGPSALATRSVLVAVSRQRARDDEDLGWFRDYADSSAESLALVSPRLERDARPLAQNGRQAWFAQLLYLVGRVSGVLRAWPASSFRAADLRGDLLALAALCVAWVEAIDRRQDGHPKPQPAPWWRRLYARFLARVGVRRG